MKKKGKTIILVISIFMLSSLTFGVNSDLVRVQGRVMGIEAKTNTIIVNEKIFVWDEKTLIANENGDPITIDKLKTRHWVYVEGVHTKSSKQTTVRRIFLLPKYVTSSERHRYPFME